MTPKVPESDSWTQLLETNPDKIEGASTRLLKQPAPGKCAWHKLIKDISKKNCMPSNHNQNALPNPKSENTRTYYNLNAMKHWRKRNLGRGDLLLNRTPDEHTINSKWYFNANFLYLHGKNTTTFTSSLVVVCVNTPSDMQTRSNSSSSLFLF